MDYLTLYPLFERVCCQLFVRKKRICIRHGHVEFGLFYYFAGFNGYLLLGHYVKKGNDWSLMKTFILCILMFAVGYYITYTGFSTTASNPNATETEMELFFTFCSPNVLLMTLATFLLLQKVVITNSTVIKVLANMTQCGFGIYMIHYFFTGPSVLLVRALGVPLGIQIPVASVFAFGASWLIVWTVYRVLGKKAKWIMG